MNNAKHTQYGYKMIEIIKEKIKNSDRKSVEYSLYKTILGEIQLEEARKNKSLKDSDCQLIIKKFLKNNTITIESIKSDKQQLPLRMQQLDRLATENRALNNLLPKTLTLLEVNIYLDKHIVEIKDSKNEGMAIGMAMKYFKNNNIEVEPLVVKECVQIIRKS